MLLLSPFRQVPGAPCDQPVLLAVPDATQKFVAIFTVLEELEATMMILGIADYKIKEVTDVNDFVASIVEQDCRVMLDPHLHGEKVRWTELIPIDQNGLTPEQQISRNRRIQSD